MTIPKQSAFFLTASSLPRYKLRHEPDEIKDLKKYKEGSLLCHTNGITTFLHDGSDIMLDICNEFKAKCINVCFMKHPGCPFMSPGGSSVEFFLKIMGSDDEAIAETAEMVLTLQDSKETSNHVRIEGDYTNRVFDVFDLTD